MKKMSRITAKQKMPAMIFGFTLLLMSVANVSFAKDVTLTWDANQEADLAGYKVYYGTSRGSYTGTEANIGPSPIDVGNTTSAALVGLDDTNSHYITITAYNVNGEESAYSNEVNSPILSNNDSDGDGVTDAEEVLCSSDPLDPTSRCSKGLPWLMVLLEDD